jgi:hypothetical protein
MSRRAGRPLSRTCQPGATLRVGAAHAVVAHEDAQRLVPALDVDPDNGRLGLIRRSRW